INQNRNLPVGQGLLCLAAEQQAGYAAPAMRAHDDEIATLRRGRVENSLVGISIARMRCVAENAGRLGDGRRFAQKLLRGVRDIGLLLLGRVHYLYVLSYTA